jgi:hypothetical protein
MRRKTGWEPSAKTKRLTRTSLFISIVSFDHIEFIPFEFRLEQLKHSPQPGQRLFFSIMNDTADIRPRILLLHPDDIGQSHFHPPMPSRLPPW